MRRCESCPTDISDRFASTRFCSPCSAERNHQYIKNKKENNPNHITTCSSCKVELPDAIGNTKYCTPCVMIRRADQLKAARQKAISAKQASRPCTTKYDNSYVDDARDSGYF